MKRNLGVERIYMIQPYQTLRVVDNIEGIPDELSLDRGLVNNLYYYMLLSAESVSIHYNALLAKLETLEGDEYVRYLEIEKQRVLKMVNTNYKLTLLETTEKE